MRPVSLDTTIRILVVTLACAIPLSVSVTTALSVLVAVLCLVNIDRQKFAIGFKNPISVAILILISIYVLTTIYSVGNSHSVILSLRKITRLLYFPLLLPYLTELRWRRWTILGYIAAVFISAIAALMFSDNLTPIFKDSIFTSLFVAYAAFIMAHLFMEDARYRVLKIVLIVFFSYYLLFTNYGRIGQLLLFVLYVIFFWQRFGFKLKYQLAAVALLIAGIITVISIPSEFSTRISIAKNEIHSYLYDKDRVMPHTSSSGLRLMMWRNSVELIKQRPLLGWGAGGFKQAYSQFVPYENVDRPEERANPHNQYLLTWVETGVFGLVALLYLLYVMLRRFVHANSLENCLGFGLVFTIIVGCLVNSWLLDFTSMFFFVLFAAVFASAKQKTKSL